jgi:tetratricopeptide (TPR) repeat protein
MARSRPRSAQLALLVAVLTWLAVPPGEADERTALRERAVRLLTPPPGGVPGMGLPLPRLQAEALGLAEALLAAGMDSLAGRAFAEAGWASFRMGQADRAQAEFERALELARRTGVVRDEIADRNALASVLASRGEMERAIRMWQGQRPLQVGQGLLASIGRSWANVSMAYSMMGRPPEALEAADSASSYFALAPTPDGPSGVAILRSQVFLALARPAEAAHWADSALASARRFGVTPAIGVALGLAAAAAEAQGRMDAALARSAEGIAFQEKAGDRFTQATPRLARAKLLSRSGRHEESRREIAGFLPWAVDAKDPTFIHQVRTLDAVNLLELGRGEEARAALESSLAAFEGMRAGQSSPLARAGLLHLGHEAYAALARIHHAAGDPVQALLAIERGRAPELARRLGAAPPTDSGFVERLKQALREAGAGLVVWSETDLQPMVVVLVTGDGLRTAELPRDTLRGAPHLALQRMAAGESDAVCRPSIAEVARASLPAALADLPGEVGRLYLVPPRRLSGFPLEVLPMPGAEGRTLGERFATAYLPSAGSLAALLARPAGPRGMVVLADPVLPQAPDSGIVLASASYRGLRGTPLPFARREMRRIGIHGATLAAGAEASEERLRQALDGNPAVIHLAAHALITTMRPAESAVLLAGGDGRLSLAEVEGLPAAAELVTLSGCRTAGGYVFAGEGTLGLPRAFLTAGTRSVVASLWDVEDRAAERFMTHFYRELRAGRARDQALQAARMALARSGFPLRDRAAFMLVGAGHTPVAALAGQELESADPPGWLWAAVGILLAIGTVLWLRRQGRGRTSPTRQ